MNAQRFLGIEIGGTKLQVVVGNADGNFISEHRAHVNRQDGAQGIRDAIEKIIVQIKGEEIAAVGVGFGGPVNRYTGRIETSFHIDGWSGFAISDWLSGLLNVPVFVDNDANVAALGEAVHGAGADHNPVLYVTLGSGVGGGLVLNGEIFYGAAPGEVEIGHIQMDRNGTTLQSLCSGWAVDEKIRNAVANSPGGMLSVFVAGRTGSEGVFLKQAVEAGDSDAINIFETLTDDIAFGFSHAVHLLHPEVLVLGGGLSLIGEMLRSSVAKKLPRYLMSSFAPGPTVKLAELREKSVPVGCLVLCNQKMKKSIR